MKKTTIVIGLILLFLMAACQSGETADAAETTTPRRIMSRKYISNHTLGSSHHEKQTIHTY